MNKKMLLLSAMLLTVSLAIVNTCVASSPTTAGADTTSLAEMQVELEELGKVLANEENALKKVTDSLLLNTDLFKMRQLIREQKNLNEKIGAIKEKFNRVNALISAQTALESEAAAGAGSEAGSDTESRSVTVAATMPLETAGIQFTEYPYEILFEGVKTFKELFMMQENFQHQLNTTLQNYLITHAEPSLVKQAFESHDALIESLNNATNSRAAQLVDELSKK